MKSPRRLPALAALLVALSVCQAEAASRLCRQLEASLGGGGGRAARAYDQAIAAQQAAIAETGRRMRAPACSGWGRSGGACGALQALMPKMQANLQTLRGKRAGMRAGKAERARIRAALEANGCRGASAKAMEVKAEASSLLDMTAGDAPQNPAIRFPRPAGSSSVCVRLCDGYFFPMTRTRAPIDDQSNCEAACPGTPIEVFYSTEGDATAMSSARTGEAYRRLGTAFQFRDEAVATPDGCGCNRGSAGAASAPAGQIRSTLAATPAAETASTPAGDRRIRVVAPAFLPDPAAAIDLQAPAPNAGR